ncbi:MAG: GNAT family N-acetyltransferase [Rhodanobacteraceae bacterium]
MQHTTRSPQLIFRTAKPGDNHAIVALTESAYRGDASRAGWTTEADFLGGQRTDIDEIDGLIARVDARFVLIEEDGRLLACCLLEQQRDGEALDCYFGMFSVRPDMQGAGLGDALLAEAERIAREQWRCRVMRMTVIDIRDELIAWYLRRGYRRTGEYKPFPYGDERFGIPKMQNLRFEWLLKPLSESRQ